MRIVYAGTPDFAVPALDAICARGHTLAAVYTQPDRRAGRGREPKASPVKARALELGLPVEQPATLADGSVASRLSHWAPDVFVVAAYGLLLPRPMLAVPRLGCLNIHASLLPRWRGAAPVQRAIEAGDTETGVCIMKMEAGLDTGPVYASVATPIADEDTGGSLTARLAALGATLLVEVLESLAAGRAVPSAQSPEGITYASKLTREEATIDWSAPALLLSRRVRAFVPWPVATTVWRAEPLKILAATALAPPVPAPPGTVVGLSALGIDVATGEGALRLTRVQQPGRRPVAARDFLNAAGAKLRVGETLGR